MPVAAAVRVVLIAGLLVGCTARPIPTFSLGPFPSFEPPPESHAACALTGGDLEGCFGPAEMFTFLDEHAEEHARNFMASEFGSVDWWPAIMFQVGPDAARIWSPLSGGSPAPRMTRTGTMGR